MSGIDDRDFEILAYIVLMFAWTIFCGWAEFSLDMIRGGAGILIVTAQAKINTYWIPRLEDVRRVKSTADALCDSAMKDGRP